MKKKAKAKVKKIKKADMKKIKGGRSVKPKDVLIGQEDDIPTNRRN